MADEPEIFPGINFIRTIWNNVSAKENRFAVIVLSIGGLAIFAASRFYNFDALTGVLAVVLFSIFQGIREIRKEIRKEGIKTRIEIRNRVILLSAKKKD